MMEDSHPRLPPTLGCGLGPYGAFHKVIEQYAARMMECTKMFHYVGPSGAMLPRAHQLEVQREPKARGGRSSGITAIIGRAFHAHSCTACGKPPQSYATGKAFRGGGILLAAKGAYDVPLLAAELPKFDAYAKRSGDLRRDDRPRKTSAVDQTVQALSIG